MKKEEPTSPSITERYAKPDDRKSSNARSSRRSRGRGKSGGGKPSAPQGSTQFTDDAQTSPSGRIYTAHPYNYDPAPHDEPDRLAWVQYAGALHLDGNASEYPIGSIEDWWERAPQRLNQTAIAKGFRPPGSTLEFTSVDVLKDYETQWVTLALNLQMLSGLLKTQGFNNACDQAVLAIRENQERLESLREAVGAMPRAPFCDMIVDRYGNPVYTTRNGPILCGFVSSPNATLTSTTPEINGNTLANSKAAVVQLLADIEGSAITLIGSDADRGRITRILTFLFGGGKPLPEPKFVRDPQIVHEFYSAGVLAEDSGTQDYHAFPLFDAGQRYPIEVQFVGPAPHPTQFTVFGFTRGFNTIAVSNGSSEPPWIGLINNSNNLANVTGVRQVSRDNSETANSYNPFSWSGSAPDAAYWQLISHFDWGPVASDLALTSIGEGQASDKLVRNRATGTFVMSMADMVNESIDMLAKGHGLGSDNITVPGPRSVKIE